MKTTEIDQITALCDDIIMSDPISSSQEEILRGAPVSSDGISVASTDIATSATVHVSHTPPEQQSASHGFMDNVVNVIEETVERKRKKGGEEQPESSVHASLVTKVAEMKEEIKDDKSFMFDVFKALSKQNPVNDTSLENVSFLELARRRGFKSPRPFWWKNEKGP